MCSYGPPHMAEQKQYDQHEHTFSSYVRIRDVVLKTCQKRWTIGKSGKRGSGISVLAARHDDDDTFPKRKWTLHDWSSDLLTTMLESSTLATTPWLLPPKKEIINKLSWVYTAGSKEYIFYPNTTIFWDAIIQEPSTVSYLDIQRPACQYIFFCSALDKKIGAEIMGLSTIICYWLHHYFCPVIYIYIYIYI